MTTEEKLIQMRTEILDDSSDSSKDDKFEILLNRAKYRYLRLVYPFEADIDTLPNERAEDWQVRCAVELYNLDGDENITQYSENGLSETYARAGLSQDLLNELPPARAGVPIE